MFWNSNFLASMTVLIAEKINTIQYQLDNNEWANAVITGSGTTGMDENHVYKYYNLEISSNIKGTITGFRLLDEDSDIIAQKTENIKKASGTALFLKFRYRLYEEGFK